jgi:hypothetical protein
MPRSQTLAFGLCAALIAFAVAALSPALLNDSDTYWHISSGGWMLDHRAILTRDVFSASMKDAPWQAQEWLSEVAMAAAFRFDGWAGIHALFGVAAALMALIVAVAVRQRVGLVPAFIVTLVGLACVSGSLLARPHLLALPLLALWVGELVAAREEDRRPGWWLLPVMAVWANLHGSFAIGLALAAALALEALVESSDRGRALLQWGLFGLAALAAALLTPHGLQGLLFPLHLLSMHGLSYIGEWAPADFSQVTPFEIALLAGFVVLAQGSVRVSLPRLVILLALVHLGLTHSRHQMIFGIAAPLLLAPSLAKAWPAQSGSAPAWPAALAAVALVLALGARLLVPVTRGDDASSPVAALAHVPRFVRDMPVLNDYAFGGYLIFRGIPDFIDSRADLYGDAFLSNYAAIQSGDKDALASSLAYYHAHWTIFTPGNPAVKQMDAMPGWHRFYNDGIAVIHIKD